MQVLRLRLWILLAMLGLAGVYGCAAPGGGSGGGDNGGMDGGGGGGGGGDGSGGGGGDGSGGGGGDGGGDNGGDDEPDPVASILYVVNNDGVPSVTFYEGAESLSGEQTPGGQVSAGASTSLFQPRSIVVTNTGRLLVSRQNGGIVGYNDATVLNDQTTADLVVEGSNTGLDMPIAFAYDAVDDRLFVGNAAGTEGILVFDGVSQAGFDGEVAPSRTFGPPDRAPFDNPSMTVDAMHVDAAGNLYVSDSQGDFSPNRNRIMVFANAGAASGEVTPARTLNSNEWGQHEDIFVDDADVLYVVDATETVHMYFGASGLDGEVTASAMLTVNIALADIQGIVVTQDGTGLLADRGNHAIYSYDDIATRSGSVTPDRILDGFETRLRGPRQMWLVEDDDAN